MPFVTDCLMLTALPDPHGGSELKAAHPVGLAANGGSDKTLPRPACGPHPARGVAPPRDFTGKTLARALARVARGFGLCGK